MKRYVIAVNLIVISAVLFSSCSFSKKDDVETTSVGQTKQISESVVETEMKSTPSGSKKKLITDIQAPIWKTYWNTNIVFEEGEAELCVKSDLGLPTEVDDATVTWKSDNPDIIETDGTVHRPEDYSPIVNLTATIETDDGYVEREFELRVIKTELDDMKPEDVWVLDEVDQVFFFNDDIDNTHVYINGDGLLSRVMGSIFEYRVDSPEEVLLALHGLHIIMGCESVFDELVIDHIVKDDYGYTFVFTQVYEGYPVMGTVVSVTTDPDGNTDGFVSYYVPIDISTDYSVTEQEAIDKIDDLVEVSEARVEIFLDDDGPKMVWIIDYFKDELPMYEAMIDANTGEVISDFLNGQID